MRRRALSSLAITFAFASALTSALAVAGCASDSPTGPDQRQLQRGKFSVTF